MAQPPGASYPGFINPHYLAITYENHEEARAAFYGPELPELGIPLNLILPLDPPENQLVRYEPPASEEQENFPLQLYRAPTRYFGSDSSHFPRFSTEPPPTFDVPPHFTNEADKVPPRLEDFPLNLNEFSLPSEPTLLPLPVRPAAPKQPSKEPLTLPPQETPQALSFNPTPFVAELKRLPTLPKLSPNLYVQNPDDHLSHLARDRRTHLGESLQAFKNKFEEIKKAYNDPTKQLSTSVKLNSDTSVLTSYIHFLKGIRADLLQLIEPGEGNNLHKVNGWISELHKCTGHEGRKHESTTRTARLEELNTWLKEHLGPAVTSSSTAISTFISQVDTKIAEAEVQRQLQEQNNRTNQARKKDIEAINQSQEETALRIHESECARIKAEHQSKEARIEAEYQAKLKAQEENFEVESARITKENQGNLKKFESEKVRITAENAKNKKQAYADREKQLTKSQNEQKSRLEKSKKELEAYFSHRVQCLLQEFLPLVIDLTAQNLPKGWKTLSKVLTLSTSTYFCASDAAAGRKLSALARLAPHLHQYIVDHYPVKTHPTLRKVTHVGIQGLIATQCGLSFWSSQTRLTHIFGNFRKNQFQSRDLCLGLPLVVLQTLSSAAILARQAKGQLGVQLIPDKQLPINARTVLDMLPQKPCASVLNFADLAYRYSDVVPVKYSLSGLIIAFVLPLFKNFYHSKLSLLLQDFEESLDSNHFEEAFTHLREAFHAGISPGQYDFYKDYTLCMKKLDSEEHDDPLAAEKDVAELMKRCSILKEDLQNRYKMRLRLKEAHYYLKLENLDKAEDALKKMEECPPIGHRLLLDIALKRTPQRLNEALAHVSNGCVAYEQLREKMEEMQVPEVKIKEITKQIQNGHEEIQKIKKTQRDNYQQVSDQLDVALIKFCLFYDRLRSIDLLKNYYFYSDQWIDSFKDVLSANKILALKSKVKLFLFQLYQSKQEAKASEAPRSSSSEGAIPTGNPGVPTPQPSKNKKSSSDTFKYGGKEWIKLLTKGDGFCAVHALLGVPNAKGVLEWSGKREEIADLFDNRREELREEYHLFFAELSKSRGVDEYDLKLKEILKPQLEIFRQKLQTLEEQEQVFLKIYFERREKAIQELVKDIERADLKEEFSPFYRDGHKDLDLKMAIQTYYFDMLRWMNERAEYAEIGECLKSLISLEVEKNKVEEQREKLLDAFIQECLTSYLKRFKEKDYYLTHHELEMVAKLKGKTVLILNQARINNSTHQAIDPNATVILHEWAHFSRCVQV